MLGPVLRSLLRLRMPLPYLSPFVSRYLPLSPKCLPCNSHLSPCLRVVSVLRCLRMFPFVSVCLCLRCCLSGLSPSCLCLGSASAPSSCRVFARGGALPVAVGSGAGGVTACHLVGWGGVRQGSGRAWSGAGGRQGGGVVGGAKPPPGHACARGAGGLRLSLPRRFRFLALRFSLGFFVTVRLSCLRFFLRRFPRAVFRAYVQIRPNLTVTFRWCGFLLNLAVTFSNSEKRPGVRTN